MDAVEFREALFEFFRLLTEAELLSGLDLENGSIFQHQKRADMILNVKDKLFKEFKILRDNISEKNSNDLNNLLSKLNYIKDEKKDAI